MSVHAPVSENPERPSVTVEFGIENADGSGIWPVPDWAVKRCEDLGKSPATWANTVAKAEGGRVMARTITVTEWAPAYAEDATESGPQQPSHDPGDPGCAEHDPHKVYTRILHWCGVCRPTPNAHYPHEGGSQA